MNLGELEQKIQEKQIQEKQMQEQAITASLENFKENLSKSLQNVLNTIENDIKVLEMKNKALIKLSMKNYCIYLTGFFLLLFLIIAGSRLVTFYLENNIYRLEEQIQQLEGEAHMAQQTLNTMKTMGITLQNVNGKNFIVIPENLSYETGWKVGSSHAIRIHD